MHLSVPCVHAETFLRYRLWISCSGKKNSISVSAVSGPSEPWTALASILRAKSARIVAFQQVLQEAGFVATVRKTRGEDIDAACGQLAGKVQDRTKRRLHRIHAVIPS